MARLSLEEMYDDRTLIKKIYDMISIVDSGTFNSLSSVQDGDDITVTFAMNDGSEKTFTFTANGIQNITSEQSGSVMTVNIKLTDGSTKSISWTITPGVTLDTAQTITAAKTLTALLTLTAGLSLTGTTTIDGDVQITNGHSLAVAGDIDVAADISGETLNITGQGEIAGMAIEPDSSGQTILSNESGIRSASRVILTNIPTTTTGAVDAAAVNGARLQADLNAYVYMVRTSGSQEITGLKDFLQGTQSKSNGLNRNTMYAAQTFGNGCKGVDVNGNTLFHIRPIRPPNSRTGRLQMSTFTSTEDGVEKSAYLDLLVDDTGKTTLRVFSPYNNQFTTLFKDE